MSTAQNRYLRFGLATAVIVLSLGYLAFTGAQENKSYYVTISELRKMGDGAYSKRLRVAGNVVPGSIQRQGTKVQFQLVELGQTVAVSYVGSEAPPDTFVDNAQALAEGEYGRDGVFHAKKLQAKCASKYAPADPNSPPQPGTKAPAAPAAPASAPAPVKSASAGD
ncbi:MAG: cytochrome c maturation protein CcmE [Acidobacteriota bacterium]|nr:cytochrome c maturation protein CcmE [Acidobacteriota bacterium]